MRSKILLTLLVLGISACSETEQVTLAGSEWKPVFEDIEDTGEAFVRFGEDGTVDGSLGCNEIQGRFTLDGGEISIRPLNLLFVPCSNRIAYPRGPVEKRFFDALFHAAKAERDGTKLSLFDAEDQKILDLKQVDAD